MILLTFFLLAVASNALTISLPPLLGKHFVGTVAFEVVDYNRTDPYALTSQPRDLMISAFYPIQYTRNYNLAKAYTPAYASFLDAAAGLAPGIAASVVSSAYSGAYLHTSRSIHPPVIFFSPGYGMSRQDYTGAMSSHGYLVLGIDHPYDTGFIDYPDGRNVTRTDLLTSPEATVFATYTRVQDVQAVLTLLTTNTTIARKIPGIHSVLNTPCVGIFGHSLGGGTSATALFALPGFRCGVNMDGAIFGPVVESDFSQPFLFMGTPFHNRTNDESWPALWDSLSGWRLELTISGSKHSTFSDQAYLYDELRKVGGIADRGDFFREYWGKEDVRGSRRVFACFL